MKRFALILLAAAVTVVSCQKNKTVQVHASFTTDKDKYDYGETVYITNTSTVTGGEIGMCKWEWGDGNVFYGDEIGSLSFQDDGEYPLTLTVYADLGAGKDTYTGKIIVSGGEVTVNFVVSQDGAGNKSGSSAANAMPLSRFKEMTSAATANLDLLDGARFEFLAGTYQIEKGQYIIGNYSRPVSFTIKGAGNDGTVFTGDNGYTIFAVQDNVTLDLVSIHFTKAIASAANVGGAVYLTAGKNGSVNLTNCLFTSCVAKKGTGGGLVKGYGSGSLTATRCRFEGNIGTGSSVNVDGGSAEHMITLAPVFTDCTFSGNNASSSADVAAGPAVKVRYGSAKFVNCTFTGNKADSNASTMWANYDANITIEGCTFSSNTATAGNAPAIFANQNSNVTIGSSESAPTVFQSNSNQNNAGAIYFKSSGLLKLDNAEFLSNSSAVSGGAIAMAGTGTIQANGCTFRNNSATATGGAVYSEATTAVGDFVSCVFLGNNALSGGAVANGSTEGEGLLRFDQCSFRQNFCTHGSIGGGAVLSSTPAARMYFNACPFYTNYSNKYGTAIDVNQGTVCLNNCTVYFNNATNDTASGNDFQTQIRVGMGNSTAGTLVVCNSSVFGRSGKTYKPSTGKASMGNPAQIIVHHKECILKLVNNLVATPNVSASSGGSLRTNGVSGYVGEQYYKYNKMSHVYSGWEGETPSAADGNCTDIYATSAYLDGFIDPVGLSAPSLDSCTTDVFVWNGTIVSSESSALASLADVNAAIKTADSSFYSWLESVSALDKDIRGSKRGSAASWPGSYDGTVTE